jgi:hypothetical protein
MRTTTLTALILIIIVGCKQQTKTESSVPLRLPDAPKATEAILNQEFPGAMPGPLFADSLIHYLTTKYAIAIPSMLLGASTCVDDIIYTKNFHLHPEIKGPFHLGGLAGLPFTGVSGLEAFAHHVPDEGTMIIIIEPHIGYSEENGWGYVLRHEQHEPSSCCGALMGTLGKLQSESLTNEISEDDYQGGKISQLALAHKEEITRAPNPIVALTKITSKSAAEQIRKHLPHVDLEHMKYVVIITGVLIDTDYQYTDYQFCDRILIYDVARKEFVEELKM